MSTSSSGEDWVQAPSKCAREYLFNFDLRETFLRAFCINLIYRKFSKSPLLKQRFLQKLLIVIAFILIVDTQFVCQGLGKLKKSPLTAPNYKTCTSIFRN